MPDRLETRQAYLQTKRLIGLFMLLFMSGFFLAACGKKPSHVDPPPGAEDIIFPRVYPDPATDPGNHASSSNAKANINKPGPQPAAPNNP